MQLTEELTNEDLLTKWMLFLSGDDKTKGAVAMTDMGIEKAYDELYRISEDEVMRERAIAREKWLSDQATRRELAWAEGLEKGKEETILSMYTEGLSVEMITRVMKMSEEKIRSIINQVH